MWKKIFRFIRKIIFSCFLLYGYNLLALPINIIIPINIITVLTISILGVPALFSFIFIYIILF